MQCWCMSNRRCDLALHYCMDDVPFFCRAHLRCDLCSLIGRWFLQLLEGFLFLFTAWRHFLSFFGLLFRTCGRLFQSSHNRSEVTILSDNGPSRLGRILSYSSSSLRWTPFNGNLVGCFVGCHATEFGTSGGLIEILAYRIVGAKEGIMHGSSSVKSNTTMLVRSCHCFSF